MFQRRHYEWLARFAANHLTRTSHHIEWELADALERDNPQFKRDRFLTAVAKHAGRSTE